MLVMLYCIKSRNVRIDTSVLPPTKGTAVAKSGDLPWITNHVHQFSSPAHSPPDHDNPSPEKFSIEFSMNDRLIWLIKYQMMAAGKNKHVTYSKTRSSNQYYRCEGMFAIDKFENNY